MMRDEGSWLALGHAEEPSVTPRRALTLPGTPGPDAADVRLLIERNYLAVEPWPIRALTAP
jgi:hypothetical protein